MSVPARRPVSIAGLVLALAVGPAVLTGCGSDTSSTATATSSTAPTGAVSAATSTLTLADGWVKAVDTGMTGMFGTLRNTGTTPVTVVGGTSDVAGMIETHEVVMVDGEMKMQPKAGGFVIPAGGTHELAPGRDHIMLMGLKKPVKAGDQVSVTLKLGDGSTVTVSGLGKPFTAGNESYQPSPGMSMAPSSSMSGM